jgi:hypothetical protein
MAIVLILSLIGVFNEDFILIKIAIVTLVATMAFPMFFKYAAVVWFGFAHLLGNIVSKIILTAIFYLVVTPVGIIRQLFGYDTLQLKKFKKGTDSVMQVRESALTKSDIEKPF